MTRIGFEGLAKISSSPLGAIVLDDETKLLDLCRRKAREPAACLLLPRIHEEPSRSPEEFCLPQVGRFEEPAVCLVSLDRKELQADKKK